VVVGCRAGFTEPWKIIGQAIGKTKSGFKTFVHTDVQELSNEIARYTRSPL